MLLITEFCAISSQLTFLDPCLLIKKISVACFKLLCQRKKAIVFFSLYIQLR